MEEVVATARLAALDHLAAAMLGDRAQAVEQAPRVAADAARVRRRPGVEADPHVGEPVPLPSSLTPIVKSFYEDVWAELPEDPKPWEWERRRAILLARRPGGASACSISGAAPGASSPRCATRAPTRSASTWPRARSSARGATCPARTCALLGADGTIPLEDSSVDLVWCSEVLEHVPDTAGLLSEVRRVLATGGPCSSPRPRTTCRAALAIALLRWDAHFDPLGQHVRFYSRRSLARVLDTFAFDAVFCSWLVRIAGAVTIRVFQGEREIAAHNKMLGQFDLMGIPPAPRGMPRRSRSPSTSTPTASSTSTPRAKSTDKEQQIRIQASGASERPTSAPMVKDAEAHAEEDKKRKAEVEAKNHAEALVHSTEEGARRVSSLQDRRARAPRDRECDCRPRGTLKGDDAAAITAKTNTLAQASMKLGEAMYKQAQEGGAGRGRRPWRRRPRAAKGRQEG